MTTDGRYCSVSLGVSRLKPAPGANTADDMDSEIPSEQLTYSTAGCASLVDPTLEQQLDVLRRGALMPQSQIPSDHCSAKETQPPSQTQQKTGAAKPAPSPVPSRITSQMSTQHREDFTTRRHLEAAVSLLTLASRSPPTTDAYSSMLHRL